MFGAIPILALSCGVATSQTPPSQVLNSQVQLGEIFSEQTLDVVTATDNVTAVTTATGNALSGGSARRDLDVQSYQELQGSVGSHGVVNVSDNMGATGTVRTAATGNTADVVINGATMTAVNTQIAGPTGVVAVGQIEAENATSVDINHSTQAVANSQSYGLINSSMGVRASQWNEAGVLADGGAILGETTGQATVSAVAAGNDFNSTGAGQSAQRAIVTQGNSADQVQASKFTTYGSSYVSNTNASATGNNINATNEGPLLDVTGNQTNTSYVRAQAETTSYGFSSSAVTAYGAGNSLLAGNFGAEVVLDNTQFNGGGGVEVIAVSDDTIGWDSSASASAAGNAATAYVCSSCSSTMTVNNNQNNTADVASRTTARMGSGRSISSVSNAVGNTASFYATSPGSSQ